MKKHFKIDDVNLPKEFKKLFCKRYIAPTMVIKSFNPEKEMIIEGIANAAQPDRCEETILPEAWNLDNYKKNSIILLEHDRDKPIGTCLDFGVDKNGLYYRARIGDPSVADLTVDQIKARSLLAQGILKANSVGFLPRVIEWDEVEETLTYTEVELLEISVVSIPMQQDSLITSVKSFGEKVMTDKVQKSDDQFGQLKDMLGENTSCTKEIHDMVSKVVKAISDMPPKEDPAAGDEPVKALKDTIAKQAKEIETLKTQLAESEKSMNDLCDNLEKQGLINGETK